MIKKRATVMIKKRATVMIKKRATVMIKKRATWVVGMLAAFFLLQPMSASPVVVVGDKHFGIAVDNPPGIWGKVLASDDYWKKYYKLPAVQKQIKRLKRQARGLQKSINNATPYISYVHSQVEKMNIPPQFSLLPLVESDYDPRATNRNGAGLWQLERATARYMHIPVNSYYDGRRDLVVSTHAALQHLVDEFNRFYSWELAAAAYNCGTGPVAKAMAHNRRLKKPVNYWAIRSQLPRITQAYVPKLVALSYVLSHASKYGITLPRLSTRSAVAVVPIKKAWHLKDIANISGASLKVLKKLNPALVKGVTSDHLVYHLVLPVRYVDDFLSHLRSLKHAVGRAK